jgi:hypothetical protein
MATHRHIGDEEIDVTAAAFHALAQFGQDCRRSIEEV